ncbi:hypothetical protein OG369_23760 [Streptomyces sp. NBC_01221]|nr:MULTISPECIES: hypothetical protein [unclassified Streptomyces]MCX4789088.1 hypothetical protein [Streptomyces sp. NBC_01221]MCX4795166.1 hypothetical protein [Streptomyces sp. NBC_01242]WSJ36483.1 hypothetical protein OG772_10870 [Streptomyces sp. NBC_01321]WSP57271.1 hypothetical protein OG306_24980 [Streptomyces sp. NBC_01241]
MPPIPKLRTATATVTATDDPWSRSTMRFIGSPADKRSNISRT